MSGLTVATVLAFIDAVMALLPALIKAGIDIAELVKKAEAVWTEAKISTDDPRWAESRAAIDEQLNKLRARARELNAPAE